jgi:hypothetical protein
MTTFLIFYLLIFSSILLRNSNRIVSASINIYIGTTSTFTCTSTIQNITVPNGANRIYVDMTGASGGSGGTGTPGKGARVKTYYTVKAGAVLHVFVGCQGSTSSSSAAYTYNPGGFNGGGAGYGLGTGGGGASDVRLGGVALTNRIAIAGGGGGYYWGGACGSPVGGSGGIVGYSGSVIGSGGGCVMTGTVAPKGGNWTSGGSPGAYYQSPAPLAGSFGKGGNAGCCNSGGGGGGYYGGDIFLFYVYYVYYLY